MTIDRQLVRDMVKQKSVQDRFMDKVMPEPNTGCWIWTAGTNIKGYGTFGIGQRRMSSTSHRVSYEMFVGEIPENMHVLHHCDNTFCVNPDHLWLGTNLDNMKDRSKKNRQARGGLHAFAKVTEIDVLIIREARAKGFLIADIARYFNVGNTCIVNIIHRINWKHI